jgi:hypothetical protein
MGDFERLYDFDELLGRHFSKMKRAIEVCTVQNYSFDLSEEDEKRLNAQWRGIAGRAAKEGKEIIQVQLCETPIDEEMRSYLRETDAYFRTFGEKFRVISQEVFQRISNGWDLTDQFWVIDKKTAIVSSFAEDGELLGNEEIADKKLIQEIAELGEKALAASLPPDEFIRKYG